jgi:hypothetical protein
MKNIEPPANKRRVLRRAPQQKLTQPELLELAAFLYDRYEARKKKRAV